MAIRQGCVHSGDADTEFPFFSPERTFSSVEDQNCLVFFSESPLPGNFFKCICKEILFSRLKIVECLIITTGKQLLFSFTNQ